MTTTPELKRIMAAAIHRAAVGDKAAMCGLHLYDLKAAGHSPTRTELAVKPTTAVTLPDRSERRSMVSSSAGW